MIQRAAPHAHTASLETALEFMNTLERCATPSHPDYPAPHEELVSLSAAIAWLAERGVLHPAAASGEAAGAAVLERVRAGRAALREVYDAAVERRPPAPSAVRAVNNLLRRQSVAVVVPTRGGVAVGHRHQGDPVEEALAQLVEPVVRAIAAGETRRLRICANEQCRYVFRDDSHAGRRRWCDMASCGNRAKAARHRARAKGAPAPGAIGGP